MKQKTYTKDYVENWDLKHYSKEKNKERRDYYIEAFIIWSILIILAIIALTV